MTVASESREFRVEDEYACNTSGTGAWIISHMKRHPLLPIVPVLAAVVIAHRPWAVHHADRILVLNHGRIVEAGTHDGLLASGGHYAEPYTTHFRLHSFAYFEKQKDLS